MSVLGLSSLKSRMALVFTFVTIMVTVSCIFDVL